VRLPHSPSCEYEILVGGHLDIRWMSWFDDMRITTLPNGTTVLSGELPDQTALHGVLQKLRDTGLPLISVTPVTNRRKQP
jgi:hypothetical protein